MSCSDPELFVLARRRHNEMSKLRIVELDEQDWPEGRKNCVMLLFMDLPYDDGYMSILGKPTIKFCAQVFHGETLEEAKEWARSSARPNDEIVE